ncbi:MAG: hypothetical protein A3F73_08680 [Gallionellales bacterium RIFCSPLOWO2_12_FULL_59_22]|nr:MAG: hypothetical protein A2W68_14135 [Betaproteobacteria bacterium RIFCSPLOWO2_02_64_14]OGS99913.1 MAG: hypothetical protein A3H99_11140 [Gallionellales bacterium RIFCSPLOWO2_02_FULL_59_110]OGT12884.1 MAG: hypothetical protein A3F73_08680 [Gallionellales bacterium RIFCSPLOWO2_12_FULL_59_22]
MNTIITNPAIAIAGRSFQVNFSRPDATDRAEIEQFIGEAFRQAYGAKLRRFKPCLMSLRDQDKRLVAACGFRSAAHGALFLETYLDRPVEAVLAEHAGFPVRRSEIIEVGNFSVVEPGMARYLIAAINDHLYNTSNQWAVFTTIPMLYNVFIKLGMHPEILGVADRNRLAPEDRSEWGSYYEHKPQIMALRRIERRVIPRMPDARSSDAKTPEPANGSRCHACGMISREE